MKDSRATNRIKRHRRVRSVVIGTANRPRLAIHKSLRHLRVQLIDDSSHKTLASASTLVNKTVSSISTAEKIGQSISAVAIKLGIKEIVFDRGGYPYHGQVKAIAEAVREAGLKF